MAKPTYYPDWATDDTNLSATGNVNKVRPRETIRTVGWDKGQIPTAEELNWTLNNNAQWIHYLVDEALPALPNTYLPLNGTKITFTSGATGTATWNGNKEVSVALKITDNSHKHLSADITDATTSPYANTISKRDAAGAVSFGRAIYMYNAQNSTTDQNQDLFFLNNTGKNAGSVNYSPAADQLQIYYIGNRTDIVSKVALRDSYVEITSPRSSTNQEGQPNSLVRFDYYSNGISSLNSDLQNYKNYALNAFIQDMRLGAVYTKVIPSGGYAGADSGGVMIGWQTEGSNPGGDTIYIRPIQKYLNGVWYTIGQL